MIESFIDFCQCSNIASATTKANEVVKRNEGAKWNMIQCQLLEKEGLFVYSMVFQRVKEVILKKPQEQLSMEIENEEENNG